MMNESILNTIKTMLGGQDSGDSSFDTDIIVHINTAFDILHQLGIGPDNGFYIEDETSKWSDFLTNGKEVNMAKTYIYLLVRKSFDPPTNSFVMDALNKDLDEYEWRLTVLANEANNYQ